MDITVTHRMGGIIEFEKTGIYPDHLIFSSASLKRSWRFKRSEGLQTGVLKINGQARYNYTFNETECKVQEIQYGVAKPWEPLEISVMMYD